MKKGIGNSLKNSMDMNVPLPLYIKVIILISMVCGEE
jgi:hypothetical protein